MGILTSMAEQPVASRSRRGVPIRLPEERWAHISENHPEVGLLKEQVLDTISDPDLELSGQRGAVLAASRSQSTGKWLVVVFREAHSEDGFIITAYLTGKIDESRITWRR